MNHIQKMQKAIDLLQEEHEYFAKCPCCSEPTTCAEGCTYFEDSPDGFAEMIAARGLLAQVSELLK